MVEPETPGCRRTKGDEREGRILQATPGLTDKNNNPYPETRNKSAEDMGSAASDWMVVTLDHARWW
jgi:hypothetical protein